MVRVEDEAPLVGGAEQDVPDRRLAVGSRRGERHRVRQRDPSGLRVFEPTEELADGIGMQIRAPQLAMLVRALRAHPLRLGHPDRGDLSR